MVMRGILLTLALILALPACLLAAQVTAVTDRDQLGNGESLQLELRVKGSPDEDPDLSVLDKDWEILNRSQSSQMQLINGSFSRSLNLSLTLMPRHTGKLEIPKICFGNDCSATQVVSVSEQATATAVADPLLLEVEAQPRQVSVGEQVLLTVHLLHRVELAQASLSDPKAEGGEADIRQLGKDRAVEVHRNGYLYRMIERRYTVFPRQAGTLSISTLQLDAKIDAGSSRIDLFGRSLQQVRRRSQPIRIEVTPPPANLGARNWLPARHLALEDDWQQQPPKLKVGEPATRTLTLTAEGLPSASLPELKVPVAEGWKSYPDQPSRQDTENEDGVVGTLQKKVALVPTHSGTLELPAIDLDWFDVATKSWKKIHLEALNLEVSAAEPGSISNPQTAKSPETPVSPVVSPAAPTSPEVVGAAPEPTEPPAADFWPWVSLVLGTGWAVTLLLFWYRRSKPATAKRNLTERTDNQDSEKTAYKMVLAAIDRNDGQATRQALTTWGRLRYPESIGREITTLTSLGGESFSEAWEELDRALYHSDKPLWSGEKLRTAISKFPAKQKNKTENLSPLYPHE